MQDLLRMEFELADSDIISPEVSPALRVEEECQKHEEQEQTLFENALVSQLEVR